MPLMYLNNQFTQSHATEAIEIRNPATEEALGSVPRGTPQDAEAAATAAQAAFRKWKHVSANER